MAASFPASVKSFTTKSPGDTIQPAHVNDAQDEISAVETWLLDGGTVGTWTPVLNFGGGTTGITYATQSGNSRKIGRVAVVEFTILLTSKGSSTGVATITGLPYAPLNNIYAGADPVAQFSSINGLFLSVAASSTFATVLIPSSTGRTSAEDTNFANTSHLRGTLVYITAS